MISMLTGDNAYAVRAKLDDTISDFKQKFGADAIDILDGQTIDTKDLFNILHGPSLFSTHKLVVIKGASANKTLWDALNDLTDSDDLWLVLVDESADKRTKTYKTFKKNGWLQEFNEPSERELVGWVKDEVDRLNGKITADVAEYIVNRCGKNQLRLNHELKKLVSYDPKVTKNSVDLLIDPNPEGSAFELLDAAWSGNEKRVNQILNDLKVSEDPYRFFGLLAGQTYALAVALSSGATNSAQVSSDTGIHSFVLGKAKSQVRNLGEQRVRQIIAQVAQTDLQLKSSGADPWHLIEVLLGKIAAK